MTLSVADGKFLDHEERMSPDAAVEAIGGWLRQNTVSRNISPSDMKVSSFAQKCKSNGCQVREYQGGVLILHDQESIRIGADTREISGGVAKKYLQILGLSQNATGQTFAKFQNTDAVDRDELYRYITVLRMLAKI